MKFYLCRDNNDMYRLCAHLPVKKTCYWCPIDDYYFNVSSEFSKYFPKITTDELLEIKIKFEEGNKLYVTVDNNNLYHVWTSEPKYYSVKNSKVNIINEFWNGGKEFMVCPEIFGKELFPNANVNNFICIEMTF